MKLDPRASAADLDKAKSLYEEVKKRNPKLEERDVSVKAMMRKVAKGKSGWLYVLFYGFPSEIVHGTVGGLYQTFESSADGLAANIRRTPQEVNGDMLASARYILYFADIMARRFQTTSHVDRNWLDGRLRALEQKYEIS